MKIGLLTNCYFPQSNGASIRVAGLARGLSAAGHNIVVLVPGTSLKREVTKHIVVWRIPVPHNRVSNIIEKYTKFHITRHRALLKHLPYIIKKEGIQIIHTRQPLDLFSVGKRIKRKYGLFWTVEAHKLHGIVDYENGHINTLHKKILLFFERKLMNASDCVVTMTNSGKSTLKKNGIKKHIIAVQNASSFQYKKTTSPFPNKRYVLYAGNLRDVEGINHLLKSFAIIHEEVKDVLCVIVGGGEVKKWQQCARKLNIEKSAIFVGEIPFEKIISYYQHATVFIHPRKNVTYHKDIIGLKFYDALNVGLPIITSDIGEMGKIIKKEKIGLVAQAENDVDFASKVIKVLKNKTLWSLLKKNARRVGQKNTWKKSCQELSKVYNND